MKKRKIDIIFMRSLFICFLLTDSASLRTFQQIEITGQWKCTEIKSDSNLFSEDFKNMIQNRLINEDVNTESKEKKYKWAIDFQRNGKANYEPCYKCDEQSLTYRIEDSTLYLNDNQIKISVMSADSLVLIIDKSKHSLVPMKK